MTKSATRTQIRASRRARSALMVAAAGASIADKVTSLPEVTDAVASGRPVAAYLAMPTEPPTLPLIDALRASGLTVLVPRVAGDALDWVRWSADVETRESALGIEEPTGPPAGPGTQPLLDCDVIVVPALALDRAGRRLGQGGGFYDRALADLPRASAQPLLVALVFDDEILTELPTEPHDVAVDIAVTPTQVVRF